MEQYISFVAKVSVLSFLFFHLLFPLFMIHLCLIKWTKLKEFLKENKKLRYSFHTAIIASLVLVLSSQFLDRLVIALPELAIIAIGGLTSLTGAIACFIGIKTLHKIIKAPTK